jgi:hypothetical protein
MAFKMQYIMKKFIIVLLFILGLLVVNVPKCYAIVPAPYAADYWARIRAAEQAAREKFLNDTNQPVISLDNQPVSPINIPITETVSPSKAQVIVDEVTNQISSDAQRTELLKQVIELLNKIIFIRKAMPLPPLA